MIGLIAERWLFFAEARHTVRLYHGDRRHEHDTALPSACRCASGAATRTGASSATTCRGSASQTVLDVVTHVQRHVDPSLAYRYACRVGMCGSCAMTVNGKARWTCRTHVDTVAAGRTLEIAPLNHLPIVRDLVVDMAPFFDKWAAAKGTFTPTATRHDDFARVAARLADNAVQSTRRSNASAARCAMRRATSSDGSRTTWDRRRSIARGRSSTTCAMARAFRDCARSPASGGCQACHTHQSCTERCPKHLTPTAVDRGFKAARRARRREGTTVNDAGTVRDPNASRTMRAAQSADSRPPPGVSCCSARGQRSSAFVSIVHLATIIYAVRNGLASEAIVARMHASPVWPAFYTLFVVAVAIHAPLGLRTIADEWLPCAAAARMRCWRFSRSSCSAAGCTPYVR